MSKNERPEALAQFAESARRGERHGIAGLTATRATAPIPTDSKTKDEAATRVLAEGATGEDQGSEDAIDRLPDRILESQEKSDAADEPEAGDDQVSMASPYDATLDPRTGRPPNPLEAQRLQREHERDRLNQAQSSDESEDVESDEDATEIDVTLEEVDGEIPEGDEVDYDETTELDQAPARMASPRDDEEERRAADYLVGKGIARERAEEIVREHGTEEDALDAVVQGLQGLVERPSGDKF